MERVLAAIQTGSTAPVVISPTPNNDRMIPATAEDMQQLMSRTGASSESSIVSTVLRRYRPLCDSILDAVCETGPSPTQAQLEFRTRALALQIPRSMPGSVQNEYKQIQEAIRHCATGDEVPTVAHVCKFTATNRLSVTDPDLLPLHPDADPGAANMIMGIARVLSGTLRTEDVDYYTFGPRYSWNGDYIPRQKIRCYLLMGSSFVRVNSVPAGHICAIYNLEALQLKTLTLCDRKECMPLHGFDFGLQPLVKVNVEPVSASGEWYQGIRYSVFASIIVLILICDLLLLQRLKLLREVSSSSLWLMLLLKSRPLQKEKEFLHASERYILSDPFLISKQSIVVTISSYASQILSRRFARQQTGSRTKETLSHSWTTKARHCVKLQSRPIAMKKG